jgi:hypothetical protein
MAAPARAASGVLIAAPASARWPRALLAALAVAACAASTAPAGAVAAPLATGISNVYENDPTTMARMRGTGATLALLPLRWGEAVAPEKEPTNWNPADPADPNYDWSFSDAWIRNAVAAGLTPVIQIRGAPAWAQQCKPEPMYQAVCKLEPAALAAFTKAAVERYSGHFEGLPQVKYWEAVNEPNISFWFQPLTENGKNVAASLYRPLLETFYATVKSVSPEDLVMAPGLAPVAVKGLTIGPMQFTRELLCMSGGAKPKPLPGDCGGGVPFDIFDIHTYTSGGPTHQGGTNDVQMGDLGKLQTLLAAADRAGRIKSASKRTPLWITEMSWDSKPPDSDGLPMKTEEQWVPEALYQAWLNKVQVFMWYSLVDQEPNGRPDDEQLQAGFYFWAPSPAAEKPKPYLPAFRFPFVAFRQGNGLEYWGRTPTGKGGKVVLQARVGGRWKRIGSAGTKAGGIFNGFVRTDYGAGKTGSVRAVYEKKASLGFPMKRVPDHPVLPFG